MQPVPLKSQPSVLAVTNVQTIQMTVADHEFLILKFNELIAANRILKEELARRTQIQPDTQLANLSQKNQELYSSLLESKQEMEKFKIEIDDLKKERIALFSSLSNKENEVKIHKNTYIQYLELCNHLKKQETDLITEFRTLQKTSASLVEELATLKIRNNEAKVENANLLEEMKQKDDRLKQIGLLVDDNTKKLISKGNEIRIANQKLLEMSNTINNRNVELANLNEAYTTIISRNQELEYNYQSAVQRNNGFEVELNRLRQASTELNLQNQELREYRDGLVQNYQQLQLRCVNLTNQVQALQQQIRRNQNYEYVQDKILEAGVNAAYRIGSYMQTAVMCYYPRCTIALIIVGTTYKIAKNYTNDNNVRNPN